MAQFLSFDPKAEVKGVNILSFAKALGDNVQPILKKHGLTNVEMEEWYPQQRLLDVLRDVSQAEYNAMFDLVSIGANIIETSDFPPGIDSIESAMQMLDMAYHMNVRNGDVGTYQATKDGERQMRVVCTTPLPCDFDYGLIYGVARRFKPKGANVTVYHAANTPCRQDGADSCTYNVVWTEGNA